MGYPRNHPYWRKTYICKDCDKSVTQNHKSRHVQSKEHRRAENRTFRKKRTLFFTHVSPGWLSNVEKLMYLVACDNPQLLHEAIATRRSYSKEIQS